MEITAISIKGNINVANKFINAKSEKENQTSDLNNSTS